jgi:hypothetical protein
MQTTHTQATFRKQLLGCAIALIATASHSAVAQPQAATSNAATPIEEILIWGSEAGQRSSLRCGQV